MSKGVIANGRSESVSISDVAKLLLESARDDRLDFRLKVAELQQTPTESLFRIRRKWERRNPLARAEWIFLAKYIRVVCEEVAENPMMPDQSTLSMVLQAFLAVRALRTDRGFGLDQYYLGNLCVSDGTSFNERQYDPQRVPWAVGKLIEELQESSGRPRPTFPGRNLFVALRDEMLPGVVTLNKVLEPFLVSLFRLVARGHWIRERRPIRARRAARLFQGSSALSARWLMHAFMSAPAPMLIREAGQIDSPTASAPDKMSPSPLPLASPDTFTSVARSGVCAASLRKGPRRFRCSAPPDWRLSSL